MAFDDLGRKIRFSDYRLPPGRHGLAPDFVAENQRWRLLGACAEALAELGYARLSTREIASRAGVSANAFYKHFDDLPDCVAAAHRIAADCLWGAVSGACEPRFTWPERVAAAVDAVLAFATSEPALARLLGPEPLAAVGEIAAAREQLIGRLAGLLRSGAGAGATELPAAAEQLTAAALAILVDRLEGGHGDPLAELAPQLVELLLGAQ